MAKQRLFPERKTELGTPHDRFSALAAKVVTASKADVEKREQKWKANRAKKAEQH